MQGTVDLRSGDASINSIVAVPDFRAEDPDPGPFELEMRDREGAVLSSIAFDVSEMVGDGTSGSEGTGLFVVAVPEPGADAHTAVVARDGSEIAVATASADPPTIESVSLEQGSVLSGDEVTISWSASDPDGDELAYTVLYRSDRDDASTTISTGSDTTEAEVFLDDLGRNSTGSILIIASDGFHSSRVEVRDITVQ